MHFQPVIIRRPMHRRLNQKRQRQQLKQTHHRRNEHPQQRKPEGPPQHKVEQHGAPTHKNQDLLRAGDRATSRGFPPHREKETLSGKPRRHGHQLGGRRLIPAMTQRQRRLDEAAQKANRGERQPNPSGPSHAPIVSPIPNLSPSGRIVVTKETSSLFCCCETASEHVMRYYSDTESQLHGSSSLMEPARITTIDRLPPRAKAVVVSCSGPASFRLQELGLLPGTHIRT